MPPDLQRAMTDSIRDAITAQIIAPRAVPGMRSPERLAIHARNYRAGLTAALGDTYPSVKQLTGEGFFGYAAAQFLGAAPPTDPIVASYGAGFPTFLAIFGPCAALPFLPDLARLEWALHDLADVLPPPVLDGQRLAIASDAQFVWSDSATLFASLWPVDTLIDTADLATVDLTKPCRLLLWTSDTAVISRVLTPAGYEFLAALRCGARLSAAIFAALAIDRHFDAAGALRMACTSRCFTHFTAIEDDLP